MARAKKRGAGLGAIVAQASLRHLDQNPDASFTEGAARAPRMPRFERATGRCRHAFKHGRYYTSCRTETGLGHRSYDFTVADGPYWNTSERNVLGMGLFHTLDTTTHPTLTSNVMAVDEAAEHAIYEHGAKLACTLKRNFNASNVQKSPWWQTALRSGRAKCGFSLQKKGGALECSIASIAPCEGKPRKPPPHEPGYEMKPELKAASKCRTAPVPRSDRYVMRVCNQRRWGKNWRGFDVEVTDKRTGKVVGKGLFQNAGNGYMVQTEGVKAATPEIELDINLFAGRFACAQKSHFVSDNRPESSSFWRLFGLTAHPAQDSWREGLPAGARPVYLTPDEVCKGPFVYDPSGVLQRRRR
jgi:hypothetical protein